MPFGDTLTRLSAVAVPTKKIFCSPMKRICSAVSAVACWPMKFP